MAAGLDKSNGNLSVVVIFTSACFYNYTLETSFPYFGVKLSCVCLRIAYRKNCLKLPKGDLMLR